MWAFALVACRKQLAAPKAASACVCLTSSPILGRVRVLLSYLSRPLGFEACHPRPCSTSPSGHGVKLKPGTPQRALVQSLSIDSMLLGAQVRILELVRKVTCRLSVGRRSSWRFTCRLEKMQQFRCSTGCGLSQEELDLAILMASKGGAVDVIALKSMRGDLLLMEFFTSQAWCL